MVNEASVSQLLLENFHRKSAASYVTESPRRKPKQDSKEYLPSGVGWSLEDAFQPYHGGGYRAGVGEVMATSMGEKPNFLIRKPITTSVAGSVGGGAAGGAIAGALAGALGQKLLKNTPLGKARLADYLPGGESLTKIPFVGKWFDDTIAELGAGRLGGIAGTAAGSLAGPIVLGLIRSKQLKGIRERYEKTQMVTPKARKVNYLSLFAGSHDLGRAQMYKSLVEGDPMPDRPGPVTAGNVSEIAVNLGTKIPPLAPVVIPAGALSIASSVVNKGRAGGIYRSLEKKFAPEPEAVYA